MSIIEKITGRAKPGPVAVATPEWPDVDGEVFVRKLSARERAEFDEASTKHKAQQGQRFVTFAAIYCASQQDGTRAFNDHDIDAIYDDPGSDVVIERLFDVADEVNVLSKAAGEKIKKNSTTVPDCAST